MTTDASKMSDEELDRAIAEAVGAKAWKRPWDNKIFLTFETMPKNWTVVNEPPTNRNSDIPRYTACLNACAEVERGLRRGHKVYQPGGVEHYIATLAHIILPSDQIAFATARQRAEALYLTLSK